MKLAKKAFRLKDSKFIKGITSFAGAVGKHYVAPNAASIAFYLFISMIPLFILICSQLPLTGISRAAMTRAVTGMIPESLKSLVSSIIAEAYESRVGVFSFSIVMLLWSSSRGVLALIRSLDIIYDEQDKRNMINMYAFSIFCTIILLMGISLLLVLYTKERTAEELIRSAIPSLLRKIKLEKLKKFYIMMLGALLVALIYKVAPAGKRKYLHQLPGAIFSAVAISLFSVYFAAYTSGSNIYKSFYGSLTSITLFLIWVYSCINLFLIGGVINSYYREQIGSFFALIGKKLRLRRLAKKELRKEKKIAKAAAKNPSSDGECEKNKTIKNSA